MNMTAVTESSRLVDSLENPHNAVVDLRTPPYTTFLIAFSVCFATAFLVSLRNSILPHFSYDTVNFKGKASTLSWTFCRWGYDPLPYFASDADPFLQYKFLESGKYDAVIEPGAQMVLSLDMYSSKFSYSVKVADVDDSSNFVVGTLRVAEQEIKYMPFSINCKPYQEFDVTVTKTSSSGSSVEYSGKAVCMYVRREIRALTDDDLSATMDAMFKLWSISDEEGQQLYGSSFRNITYLLQMHHFNAGAVRK